MVRINFQDKKVAISILILSITILVVGVVFLRGGRGFDIYYSDDYNFSIGLPDSGDQFCNAGDTYIFNFKINVMQTANDYLKSLIDQEANFAVVSENLEIRFDANDVSADVSWSGYGENENAEWIFGEFEVLSIWTTDTESDPVTPDHFVVFDPQVEKYVISIPIIVSEGNESNEPPTTPEIINTASAIDAGGKSNVTWDIWWDGGVDYDGYIDSWRFQLATSTSFDNTSLIIDERVSSVGGSSTGHITVYVNENGNYFARVNARDDYGETSAWSSIFQFTVTGITDDGGGGGGGDDPPGGTIPEPPITDTISPLEAWLPWIIIGVAAIIITVVVANMLLARRKQQQQYYGGYDSGYGGGYY